MSPISSLRKNVFEKSKDTKDDAGHGHFVEEPWALRQPTIESFPMKPDYEPNKPNIQIWLPYQINLRPAIFVKSYARSHFKISFYNGSGVQGGETLGVTEKKVNIERPPDAYGTTPWTPYEDDIILVGTTCYTWSHC